MINEKDIPKDQEQLEEVTAELAEAEPEDLSELETKSAIVEVLPEPLREFLDAEEEIPQEVKERLEIVITKAMSFRGPLPPPNLLREYGELMPELPQQIVEMASKEQDHRHEMESGGLKTYKSGQFIGASLMILLISGAGYSVFAENTLAVGIFLGTAVLGVISKFITFPKRGDD